VADIAVRERGLTDLTETTLSILRGLLPRLSRKVGWEYWNVK
jgi:hypothetical protein